jgi:hypothetical protein
MVLARPGGAPAPAVTTTSVADGEWSDAGRATLRASRAERGPAPEPALAAVDVARLTERVVAAIDRRMTAARERLGG